MENQIRKVVLGTDYKAGMHFTLGQEVFGKHKIIAILRTETDGVQIYIEKDGEEKIWKEASCFAGFFIEYSLDY